LRKESYDYLLNRLFELSKELNSPPPDSFDWIEAVLELRAKMAELTQIVLDDFRLKEGIFKD